MNNTEMIQQAIKVKIEKHSASIKKMNDEAIKLATENLVPLKSCIVNTMQTQPKYTAWEKTYSIYAVC